MDTFTRPHPCLLVEMTAPASPPGVCPPVRCCPFGDGAGVQLTSSQKLMAWTTGSRQTHELEGGGWVLYCSRWFHSRPPGSIDLQKEALGFAPRFVEKVSRRMGSVRLKRDRNAMALAALRIAVGLLFLIFGQHKVFGTEFTLGGGFQTWITRFLADGSYPCMAPILRGFVLPHGTAIALPGGLRRIGYRPGARPWLTGAPGERVRNNLYAGPAVLLELPGPARSLLAVFWHRPRTLGAGTLLRCFCAGRNGPSSLSALLCGASHSW
jgi:hypothetical protein